MTPSVAAGVGRTVLCGLLCWSPLQPTATVAASAQEKRPGTLVVVVVDPSGAAVPGCPIALTPTSGAATEPIAGHTDAQGGVVFHQVPPGAYDLHVDLAGFEVASPSTLRVRGGPQNVTVRLALARVEQTLTVRSPEMAGDAGGSPFTRILTPLEIAALPDDPVAMEEMLRRMAGPGATILVDGFRRGLLPPKSAIALITIKWADLSAETHQQSSVVVEIITKPGGSALDGTVTMALQPRGWIASDPFSDRPASGANTGSLMVSGPIWKGRTSFMANVRAVQRVEPTAFAGVLPHADVRILQADDRMRRDGYADWQISHQFGPAAFLRVGGTSMLGGGKNLGVGGFDLPERAFTWSRSDHTGRLSLYAGRDASLFNQLRVSARAAGESWSPLSDTPAVSVAGAFNGGGAQRAGSRRVREWSVEDDLDIVRGRHALRAGFALEHQAVMSAERVNEYGTFTFANLTDYEERRPSTFTRRIGNPEVRITTTRGGAYIQDEVRLSQSVTLGLGLRWEAQGAIQDGLNPAPRIRVSWSPRAMPPTAVKGGVGWYYDWVETDLRAQVARLGASGQSELVVVNPGYPDVAAGDATIVLPPSRYRFAEDASLPMVRRVFLGVDHQIGNATLRAVVEDMSSANGLRARNLNAALANGERPDPAAGRDVLLESGRRVHVRTVRLESRSRGWRRSLVVLSYELRWSRNNADGALSLPSDSHNPEADWGPAADDARHRGVAYLFMPVLPALTVTATASIGSGAPYTITTGRDDNGDTVVNDRPPGVARNSRRGGVTGTVDARLMWRVMGALPGQMASGSGTGSTQTSSLTVNLSVQNVLNRTNPVVYSGVLGSALFGQPLGAQAMRRVELGFTIGF